MKERWRNVILAFATTGGAVTAAVIGARKAQLGFPIELEIGAAVLLSIIAISYIVKLQLREPGSGSK